MTGLLAAPCARLDCRRVAVVGSRWCGPHGRGAAVREANAAARAAAEVARAAGAAKAARVEGRLAELGLGGCRARSQGSVVLDVAVPDVALLEGLLVRAALSVGCPVCASEPGEGCDEPAGVWLAAPCAPHSERVARAVAAAGEAGL